MVDQLRYSYPIGRKAKRAWPRLIWWLIDIAIVNSYTLYRLDNPSVTQLDFRKQLMQELAAPLRKEKAAQEERVVVAQGVPLAKDHVIKHTSEIKSCQCKSQHADHRSQSHYLCTACGVHLCIDPCFGIYHKELHAQALQ